MKNNGPVGRQHRDQNAELLENAARAAVETNTARALTDEEWESARTRLLQFATILRDWDRQTKTNPSRADKVVSIQEAATVESELNKAA